MPTISCAREEREKPPNEGGLPLLSQVIAEVWMEVTVIEAPLLWRDLGPPFRCRFRPVRVISSAHAADITDNLR